MLHNLNNKKNIKLKYYPSKYNHCSEYNNSKNDTKTEDDKKMNEKDLNKTIISQTGT